LRFAFLLVHAFLQARAGEIVDSLEAVQDQLPEPGVKPHMHEAAAAH